MPLVLIHPHGTLSSLFSVLYLCLSSFIVKTLTLNNINTFIYLFNFIIHLKWFQNCFAYKTTKQTNKPIRERSGVAFNAHHIPILYQD